MRSPLVAAVRGPWAKALAERYSVAAPKLQPADARMDPPQDIKVDVSWDTIGRAIIDPSQPVYVPGHRTVVHIPFTGDKSVFSLRPSSFTLNPPRADVADGELRLVVEYPSDRPANITALKDELASSGREQRASSPRSNSSSATPPGATPSSP